MELAEALENAVDNPTEAPAEDATKVEVKKPPAPKRTARKVTKAKKEKPKPKREPLYFIMHEIRVDKFNTIRERRLLSPVTCKECGWDAALDNDLDPFWEIDEETGDYIQNYEGEEETAMKNALKAHIKAFHDISQQKVIAEDNMPTAWLGKQKRKQRKRK